MRISDWSSDVCSSDLARQGFFVSQNGIAINSHHPRFGDEGEAMFDDDGQPARLVRPIQRVLGQLTVGIEESDAFIAALLAHTLIESIDISLRFDDGETLRLEGLYSIGLDALHVLSDATGPDLARNRVVSGKSVSVR